jgi:hypothetical protein
VITLLQPRLPVVFLVRVVVGVVRVAGLANASSGMLRKEE